VFDGLSPIWSQSGSRDCGLVGVLESRPIGNAKVLRLCDVSSMYFRRYVAKER
jgi:hypothetical protein